MKTYILSVALLIIATSSCQKSGTAVHGNLSGSATADVYVTGYAYNSQTYSNDNTSQAVYWKNGQEVLLTGNRRINQATAIAIDGDDIYIAGYGSDQTITGGVVSGTTQACYWKNGQQVLLPGNCTEATGIAISGTDVYVVGWDFTQNLAPPYGTDFAVYWKNGQEVALAGNANESTTTGVAISGNDVYISGQNSDGTGGYWKNGQWVALNISSDPQCITISNGDVYVPGGIDQYWKNRQSVTLDSAYKLDAIRIGGIAIAGTDVYVTGAIGDVIAAYWKNGTCTRLFSDSTTSKYMSGIAISGNDVYLTGSDNSHQCYYWENSQQYLLTDVIGSNLYVRVTGIAVHQ